jgi:hypothetical protein
MTTKILALTDALGNLVRFVLLPGQRFDTVGVAPLIEGVEFGALIADMAFDSNDIISDLDRREVSPKLGDGLRDQAAAVWDFEGTELATTSIPSVNLTP